MIRFIVRAGRPDSAGSVGLQPVFWSKLLMFFIQASFIAMFGCSHVLFLRPDREEASVMPLINAGFNRVSENMCDCEFVCLLLPVFVLFFRNVFMPPLSTLTVGQEYRL